MFRLIKSLLAGLVAGTALGVLFSPDKGSKIRKDLKKELDEGGLGLETIKKTLAGLGEEISETDAYQDAEEEVKKKVKKATTKAKRKVVKTVKSKTTAAQRKKAKAVVSKAKSTAKKAAGRVKKSIKSKK